MDTELLIIGGGPAGISAAYKAIEYGVKTTIVDKWFVLGGQLNNQTQIYNNLPYNSPEQRGFILSESLVEGLKNLKITLLNNHEMIGVYKNGSVGVTDGKNTFPIPAKKIIIAPGASEEPRIFPGWTLPGVITVGAAQILMNRERVLPGRRALIWGSNDFSLETALQLFNCGINVKGIIEEGSKINCQDDELLDKIYEANIPVFLNSFVESASGKGEIEKTVVRRPENNRETFVVDFICISAGLTPVLEPFDILGCDLTYHKQLGGWLPKYNSLFQTSTSYVYVAGDAAGITNLNNTLLSGKIAAMGVVKSLNTKDKEKIQDDIKNLWVKLYHNEMSENHLISEARSTLIKNFHIEQGAQFPHYLSFILEDI